MSHTKIHDTLTKPDLPAKGAVEMITEVLAEKIHGADANAEIDRLLGLWNAATPASQPSPFVTPESPTTKTPTSPEPCWSESGSTPSRCGARRLKAVTPKPCTISASFWRGRARPKRP
ncbi:MULTISPECIES: hypothetical protein [unclassified Nocardiopsis]|uniref:hypothetical protein n=1 Tax=unclassified Nocardiopsis TaxID=2649073 RepID=UPI0011610258|nr:hypothetical protein [Nocardiopsis sp. TSRI0078]